MSARDDFLDRFAACRTLLPGASLPWMQRARNNAIGHFAELGLPTTRQEDWKYTSVAAIERQTFDVGIDERYVEGLDREVARHALDGAHRLVFIDGRYAAALSSVGKIPDGVRVESLAQPITSSPWRFEEFFADDGDAAPPANGFSALNAAFWADGAHVEIGPGIAVEHPIQLLFIATRANLANFPYNLVRVGAGASATVIEQYVGVDRTAYLTDAVSRLVIGQGARLAHTKLQQEGDRAFHLAERRVAQASGSHFASQSFAFGGRLARDEIATRLDEGCEASLIGLYVGSGRQHHDQHTCIDHARPRGTSRESYKGILDDASRAVFNGRVIVRPDAQLTDAKQSNRNLLLSDDAEVDTKPQLEIWADDVRCAHGATVGQLDADQLHYLRARGIDEAAARGLLTYAFAADILYAVDDPVLRGRIATLLPGSAPEHLGEAECEMLPTK